MKINNRRYIGCKTKLLDFISSSIECFNLPKSAIFADIFAGTGVVAYHFAKKGFKTILNDTLYSNFVIYKTFFSSEKIREDVIESYLKKYNSLDCKQLKNNYFSKIYGDKYFSIGDAKKIGFIRDDIESNKINLSEREYYYLITSLLYACDKIANTVGHFESFLSTKPEEKGIKLEKLEIEEKLPESQAYNIDANELSKIIKADVVYIDPPYNARQYVNFYHVLENLARWNKPTEFEL